MRWVLLVVMILFFLSLAWLTGILGAVALGFLEVAGAQIAATVLMPIVLWVTGNSIAKGL